MTDTPTPEPEPEEPTGEHDMAEELDTDGMGPTEADLDAESEGGEAG
jgi:hypothetical protein